MPERVVKSARRGCESLHPSGKGHQRPLRATCWSVWPTWHALCRFGSKGPGSN